MQKFGQIEKMMIFENKTSELAESPGIDIPPVNWGDIYLSLNNTSKNICQAI